VRVTGTWTVTVCTVGSISRCTVRVTGTWTVTVCTVGSVNRCADTGQTFASLTYHLLREAPSASPVIWHPLSDPLV
jgi:hypothetical protein